MLVIRLSLHEIKISCRFNLKAKEVQLNFCSALPDVVLCHYGFGCQGHECLRKIKGINFLSREAEFNLIHEDYFIVGDETNPFLFCKIPAVEPENSSRKEVLVFGEWRSADTMIDIGANRSPFETDVGAQAPPVMLSG